MRGYVPNPVPNPGPEVVLFAILAFYLLGALWVVKGLQDGSRGAVGVGVLLAFAGTYYMIKWIQAKRKDRER
jgi:hypothetical protein